MTVSACSSKGSAASADSATFIGPTPSCARAELMEDSQFPLPGAMLLGGFDGGRMPAAPAGARDSRRQRAGDHNSYRQQQRRNATTGTTEHCTLPLVMTSYEDQYRERIGSCEWVLLTKRCAEKYRSTRGNEVANQLMRRCAQRVFVRFVVQSIVRHRCVVASDVQCPRHAPVRQRRARATHRGALVAVEVQTTARRRSRGRCGSAAPLVAATTKGFRLPPRQSEDALGDDVALDL